MPLAEVYLVNIVPRKRTRNLEKQSSNLKPRMNSCIGL